jgi:hypothetical protein
MKQPSKIKFTHRRGAVFEQIVKLQNEPNPIFEHPKLPQPGADPRPLLKASWMPRGIRTPRATLILFATIFMVGAIFKHGPQDVRATGWGVAVLFVLVALYEIHADWRTPKSH